MTEAEIRQIFAKPLLSLAAPRTGRLDRAQRAAILAKTDGNCHVCGGAAGAGWQADHVVPHAHGGKHSLDNYLAICRTCNRLRWSYDPATLRLIMQFGIYAKQEIRKDSQLGRKLIRIALRGEARSGKSKASAGLDPG